MLRLFSLLIFVILIGSCSMNTKKVVFMGDSHIARWNVDKYFPLSDNQNAGIGGEKVEELLLRVDSYSSDINVIIIGTNNYIASSGQLSDEFYENIDDLLYKSSSLFSKTIFISVPPLSFDMVKRVNINANTDYITINSDIKQICNKYENVIYEDINSSLLSDDNGFLKQKYSLDGVHLNARGYELISSKIIKYVD